MANVKRCLGWVCRIAYPTAMCRDYGIAQILTKIGRIEQFFFPISDMPLIRSQYAAYWLLISGKLDASMPHFRTLNSHSRNSLRISMMKNCAKNMAKKPFVLK